MPQKIFQKISISTLMAGSLAIGLGTAANVFADDGTARPYDGTTARAFKADGSPAWSVEELNALNFKLADEREVKCGNDSICRDQVYWDQYSRDGFYRALNPFNSKYFLITAVYPEQNKIKIMFHDEDQWMKAIGFERRTPYTEAYVAWFDATFVYGVNWIDNAREGIPTPGVNVIYAKDIFAHMWEEEEIDEEYMDGFPSNKEIEVVAPEANMMSNARRRILFEARSGGIYDTTGVYEYGECLSSPNYSPEVGCHLYYDENYDYFYLPIETPALPEQYVYIADDDGNDGGEGDDSGGGSNTGEADETGDGSGDDGGGEVGGSDNDNGETGNESGENLNNETNSASGSEAISANVVPQSVHEVTTIERTAPVYIDRTVYRYLATNTNSDRANNVVASLGSDAENKDKTDPKANNEELASNRQDPLATTTMVEAPTSGEVEKEVIFPWWFIVVVLVADVGVIWLLWSKYKNSLKKSQKL